MIHQDTQGQAYSLPPDPLSKREDPMESISSIKIMDGACSLKGTSHKQQLLHVLRQKLTGQ